MLIFADKTNLNQTKGNQMHQIGDNKIPSQLAKQGSQVIESIGRRVIVPYEYSTGSSTYNIMKSISTSGP